MKITLGLEKRIDEDFWTLPDDEKKALVEACMPYVLTRIEDR